VVALHVCAHAKVVDNHAADAGRGAEDAAGGHQDVDVLGLQAWGAEGQGSSGTCTSANHCEAAGACGCLQQSSPKASCSLSVLHTTRMMRSGCLLARLLQSSAHMALVPAHPAS
jgi:hypothetical protein